MSESTATQTATQEPQANESETIKGFKSIDDFPARVVFKAGENALASAFEHIQKVRATEGFNELNLPMIVHGTDEEGNIDSSVYEGQDIYVIMLRNKGAGYRALVCQPAPTLESLLESEEARAWIFSLLETQVGHKMVRTLRAKSGDTASAITQADINEIPHTIADYVATQRRGGAVAFWNKHAKTIIDAVGARVATFKAARISKDMLRQALQSKPFAEAIYPPFEKAGLFEKIGQTLIQVGNKEGSDVSTIESWLENRENVEAAAATGEITDIGVDDLFGDLDA